MATGTGPALSAGTRCRRGKEIGWNFQNIYLCLEMKCRWIFVFVFCSSLVPLSPGSAVCTIPETEKSQVGASFLG